MSKLESKYILMVAYIATAVVFILTLPLLIIRFILTGNFGSISATLTEKYVRGGEEDGQ